MDQGVSDKTKRTKVTRTRKRPEEVYIVEYAMSDSAKETVCDKLERLMLAEAERLVSERAS